jgi:DNA-binding CsgD family transcriptional regulator/PAS domain-containing protein
MDGSQSQPYTLCLDTQRKMQALQPNTLSSIIGDVYDCALHPQAWGQTLTRISSAMNSAYCTIAMGDTAQAMRPVMAVHSPWDPAMLQALNDDFGLEGVPGLKAVAFGDVDTPRSTLQDMSEADFQQTPFYLEWVKPQGLREACAMKFTHTEQRIGLIASVIRADRDVISEDERQFMALLSAHLRRAALIGDLLNYERLQSQSLRDTLGNLATPVFLLDRHAGITFANPSAQALLEDNVLTKSKSGQLTVGHASMHTALVDAVARCAGVGSELGSRGIGIPISNTVENTAIAYVLPIGQTAIRSGQGEAVAAVFIANSAHSALPTQEILIAVFGLTPAESRVMLAVGEGATPAQAALRLHITENTVKTHLARVYTKSGAHRQSDIVQLLMSIGSPGR